MTEPWQLVGLIVIASTAVLFFGFIVYAMLQDGGSGG